MSDPPSVPSRLLRPASQEWAGGDPSICPLSSAHRGVHSWSPPSGHAAALGPRSCVRLGPGSREAPWAQALSLRTRLLSSHLPAPAGKGDPASSSPRARELGARAPVLGEATLEAAGGRPGLRAPGRVCGGGGGAGWGPLSGGSPGAELGEGHSVCPSPFAWSVVRTLIGPVTVYSVAGPTRVGRQEAGAVGAAAPPPPPVRTENRPQAPAVGPPEDGRTPGGPPAGTLAPQPPGSRSEVGTGPARWPGPRPGGLIHHQVGKQLESD